MVNQQMLDYIRQEIGRGHNKEQIKISLMDNDWEEADVEEGFVAVGLPPSMVPPAPTVPVSPNTRPAFNNTINPVIDQQPFVNNQKKSKPWGKIVFFLLIVILVGAGWFGYKYFNNLKTTQQAVTPVVNQEANQTSEQTSSQNNPAPVVAQNTGPQDCGTIRDEVGSYLAIGFPANTQPTVNEKSAIACMDNAVANCVLATLNDTKTGQSISFEVRGMENNNCVMSIGNFADKRITTCKIPLSLISEFNQQAQQAKKDLAVGFEFLMASEIPISGVKSNVTISGHPGLKLDCTTI